MRQAAVISVIKSVMITAAAPISVVAIVTTVTVVPGVVPTAVIPGRVPSAIVPGAVPAIPAAITVVPWIVPTAVVPGGIPSAVIPGAIPAKSPPHIKVKIGVTRAVIIIIVEVIAYIDDYLIGTLDLDTRLRIMEADNSVGICILFIIVLILFIDDGIFRQNVAISTTIVFVDISAIGRHLHIGCVTLDDNHFFLLWFIDFFLNHYRFIFRGIGIYIIPFLGETK